MQRVKCILTGIKNLLVYGHYLPHTYVDTVSKSIIIATDKDFRVSDNYKHNANEKVYPNGCLITSQCVHCGHKDISWYCDYTEWIMKNR